jgi:PKD repeat protein
VIAGLRLAAIAVAAGALAGCGAIDGPSPYMHVLPSRNVQTGQTVTFDATQMPGDPPDHASLTTTYKWDLDGNGSFEAHGNVVRTTYAQPGHYDVTLIETNTNGLSYADGWQTVTVVVGAPPSGGPPGGGGGQPQPNQPPSASFTYSPDNPCTECQTNFDASGSSDSDGQIVNYQWDWDNNGTWDTSGPGPTATHHFDVPTTYTVRLRVTDDDGDDAITERRFTVNDAPPGKLAAGGWPALTAAGAGTPFSLKLGTTKLTPGTKTLNGVKLVTAGLAGRGKLRFARLPKALKPHRNAKWAGTLSLVQTGNGAAARLKGQGYLLLRFSRSNSLCFAGKVGGDYTGKPFKGTLATVGGSGLGAHVRGTGTFSLPVTGKDTKVTGHMKLRRARKPLVLPRACRPLARTLRR